MTDALDTSIATAVSGAKRRSAHGAVAILAGQIAKFVLQFGSQIILARLLDPAQYGLLAMTAPVLGFVQTINDLGLGQAVVQRSRITPSQISALFWVNAGVSGVLALCVCVTAPVFAWLYHEPQITLIIRVLGCLIFVSGLTIIPTALLNRQLRFIPLAIIDVIAVSSATGIAIVAALAGLGTWALVIAQVVSSIVVLLTTWYFAGWSPSVPRREPHLADLLRFGAHVTGANLAGYLSMSADRVLIGYATGTVSLGLYDRSYRLVALPLTQLMAPISRVAIPLLSRLDSEVEGLQRVYLQMVQFTFCLTVPIMILSIVMAAPIVAIVFGVKWIGAAPIFAWICLGGTATSTFASTYWLFTSQGRTLEQLRLSFIVSAINVASFAVGIPWGAEGVAAVSGLSFVLVQTPIMVWGATQSGAVSRPSFANALAPLIAASLVTAIVLRLLPAEGVTLVRLILDATIAYGVFGLALACLPGGRILFRQALRLAAVLRKAA